MYLYLKREAGALLLFSSSITNVREQTNILPLHSWIVTCGFDGFDRVMKQMKSFKYCSFSSKLSNEKRECDAEIPIIYLINSASVSQINQSNPQKALKFNSLPPTVATISPFPDTLYFTQQLT